MPRGVSYDDDLDLEGDEPELTTEEWLALLDEDEPTDVNANAAEILRDIREHGER